MDSWLVPGPTVEGCATITERNPRRQDTEGMKDDTGLRDGGADERQRGWRMTLQTTEIVIGEDSALLSDLKPWA